jgi:hypothetical protein
MYHLPVLVIPAAGHQPPQQHRGLEARQPHPLALAQVLVAEPEQAPAQVQAPEQVRVAAVAQDQVLAVAQDLVAVVVQA